MTDKPLERILITNDDDKTPVAADESARLPDPFLSPPCATGGTMRGYVTTALIAAALVAVGYVAWSYCKDAPKATPSEQRR